MTPTILGIDPGSQICGYALIQADTPAPKCLHLGCIHLEKEASAADKLYHLYQSVCQLIAQHHPKTLSIERPFLGRNVKSFQHLTRAQGAVMAAAGAHQVPVFEYMPTQIKKNISISGLSDKTQVLKMLESVFKITIETRHLDASDALAAAYMHFTRRRQGPITASKRSWKDFIQAFPDRHTGTQA